MKATYNKETGKGFNVNHRKENNFQEQYTGFVIVGNELKEVVNLRLYGTQAMNYCCVWVLLDDWTSGSGKAGGYGYHRPSAAAQEAIENAGITLSDDISGRGDGAIERAVRAICELHYPEGNIVVHKAHG